MRGANWCRDDGKQMDRWFVMIHRVSLAQHILP
jgi:hypothetical protein